MKESILMGVGSKIVMKGDLMVTPKSEGDNWVCGFWVKGKSRKRVGKMNWRESDRWVEEKDRDRDRESKSLSFWSIGSGSFANAKVVHALWICSTSSIEQTRHEWILRNHSLQISSPLSSSTAHILNQPSLSRYISLSSLSLLFLHGWFDWSQQRHRGRWNDVVWLFFLFGVFRTVACVCGTNDFLTQERKRCCVLAARTLGTTTSSRFSATCLCCCCC